MAPKKVTETTPAPPATTADVAKPTKTKAAAPAAVEVPAVVKAPAKTKASKAAAATSTVAAPVATEAKPKKARASKAAATSEGTSPAEVIKNATKPAVTPSGETVSLQKTKREKKVKDPNAPPRQSAYNDYMSKYMALEKQKAAADGTAVDHRTLFSKVASTWKTSAEKAASDAQKAAKTTVKVAA